MNRKINFSSIKMRATMFLHGSWFMFGLCMLVSTIVFMLLIPEKYIYFLVQPTVELGVLEHFRIFVATAISESLMFTLTVAMYRVIFKRTEEEKRGVGLLFKNANLIFPSSVIPVLLTKVLLSFLSFLTTPAVSNFFYDYLFFTAVDYIIYNWAMLVMSLIISVVSLYVNLAYILTPCVIADNPEISGIDAMRISRIYMKNKKLNMVWFLLSFAVWYMIGMCGFGIGMMWAHAYTMTAVYVYYLDVKTA